MIQHDTARRERNDWLAHVFTERPALCSRCGAYILRLQMPPTGDQTVHDCGVGRLSARMEAGRLVWCFEPKRQRLPLN